MKRRLGPQVGNGGQVAPVPGAAQARLWPLLWRAAAAVVLVNAPFWWLSQSVFMSRALVNLDSVLAAAVMAVSLWLGLPLLLAAWALDGAVGQSFTYHFTNPVEFIKSVRFATTLDWWHWIDWKLLGIALPFIACLALLRLVVWRRRASAIAIAACAVILMLLDALNGSSLLAERDAWRWSLNLAGSPAATVALHKRGVATPMVNLPTSGSLQGLIDVPAWAARHPDGSILLVIVESLGGPVQPVLRAWLDEQVRSPAFDLTVGDVPFRGATTAGELRTLCTLGGSYAGLGEEMGGRCLPAVLAALGWKTLGMHGFARRMFDRETWWPKMGLQQQLFVESAPLSAGPRCGRTFTGTCDAWLIGRALEWAQESKRFAYALTLNTHLPLPPTPVPPALAADCRATGTPLQACDLIAALGAVLRDTSRMAAQAGRRPLVLIVGDHAPPFNDREARDAFRSDTVPAYILRPIR